MKRGETHNTAHSPLIVQSAENVNVVLLHKEGDHVTISQQPFRDLRGWTVDGILTILMELDSARSGEYLCLIRAFEDAIDEERGEDAQQAYKQLAAMMNPGSARIASMQLELAPFGSIPA